MKRLWLWLCFSTLMLSEQLLPSAAIAGKLKFVVMTVNGKHHQLAAGETLEVVWGDKVEILFAQLEDGQDVEIINVVGFRARKDSADDRGVEFRTDRDLNSSWAHDPIKGIYRVNFQANNKVLARVYLKVNPPQLKYVVAQINGKETRLQAGQKVSLRSQDQIELKKIIANLDPNDPSFRYRIMEQSPQAQQDATHEIQFYRYEKLFAKIPLVVTEQ